MRIAIDSDFRQLDKRGVAAVFVDCFYKFSGHLQPDAPIFIAQIFAWLLRNIITKVQNNRNPGQLLPDSIRGFFTIKKFFSPIT